MQIDTKIIKINPCCSDEQMECALEPAAEIIKRGGLVAFPTETVYGLGADGTNPGAARRIFDAKGRPSDNPLIIHIANPLDASKIAYVNDVYFKLAEAFMPGPMTVILNSRGIIPKETLGGLDTVAIRCPSNPIARKLIELSSKPIAAPSANLSGSPSPTAASHVISDMTGRIDAIIDGGECDFGLESTIVKIDSDDSVTLLRPGKITVADIASLGLKVSVAYSVTDKLREGDVALSPGMKYRHYAPKADVVLLDAELDAEILYIKENSSGKTAVISYSEDVDKIRSAIGSVDVFEFGSKLDLNEQAHRLFALLRLVDDGAYDRVFAPLPSTEGVGLALYNRMIRAAAHKIIRL